MDTPAQQVNTTPPPTAPQKQKSSAMLFFSVIIILLLGGLAFVSYQLFLKDSQLTSVQQAQQKTVASNQITLPKDAVQITGCLPYMGIHWVEPQNIPHGPYYVTYKGQMIAIEYMYKPDDIPGQAAALASPSGLIQYMQDHKLSYADLFKQTFTYDISGLNVKYWDLTWTPPHAGYTTPHYDMHFFLVGKDVTKNICPDAKPEEAQSPQIEQELKKNNIPFIPVEQPSTQSTITITVTPTVKPTTTTTTKY